MRWFRVTMKSDTDGYDLEIVMDVLRDKDGLLDSGITFFGYWRDRDTTSIEPFVLMHDNMMDWGTEYVSKLTLRGSKIMQGSVIPYAGYKNNPAFERKQIDLAVDFTVTSIRDHTTTE